MIEVQRPRCSLNKKSPQASQNQSLTSVALDLEFSLFFELKAMKRKGMIMTTEQEIEINEVITCY